MQGFALLSKLTDVTPGWRKLTNRRSSERLQLICNDWESLAQFPIHSRRDFDPPTKEGKLIVDTLGIPSKKIKGVHILWGRPSVALLSRCSAESQDIELAGLDAVKLRNCRGRAALVRVFFGLWIC